MKGVTILELLVVIALTAIIAGAVVTSTSTSITGVNKAKAKEKVISSLERARSFAKNSGTRTIINLVSNPSCTLSYEVFLDNFPYSTTKGSEDLVIETVCEKNNTLEFRVNGTASNFVIFSPSGNSVTSSGAHTTSSTAVLSSPTSSSSIAINIPQLGEFTASNSEGVY